MNNTVINEGQATTVMKKASGRKVQAVPVQELRHQQGAVVVSKQRTPTATGAKKVQTPVSSEAEPGEKKTVAVAAPTQVQEPAAVTPESAASAPKNNETQDEKHKPVPAAPEFKSEAKHRAAINEPTDQKANKPPVKQKKPAKPSDKKEQQPAKENPVASEKTEPNPKDKDHEKKSKE